MKPSLIDSLCTRCGLCCDGSLFADVELARRDEAAALEVMGLEIEDADAGGGGLLLQPCGALKEKRCSIYPYRPDCCRTFECRLLQQVKRDVVGVDHAQAKIAEALQGIGRVHDLIGQLGPVEELLPLKERFADALAHAEEVAANSRTKRTCAELQTAMTSVEQLLQESFLGF